MKGLLTALLALLVIAAAVLFVKAGPTGAEGVAQDVDRARLATASDDAAELAPIPAEGMARDAAPSHETVPSDVAVPEVDPGEAQAVLSPEVQVLEGSLVVRRLDGTEQQDATGEIVLILWEDESGRHRSTPVTDGSFKLELSEGGQVERVTLWSVTVEDRPMKVVGPKGDLELDAPIQVIAEEPRPCLLEVVAEGTGAHLSSIRLVTAPGYPSNEVVVPVAVGGRSLLAEGLTSPVDLSPHLGTNRQEDLLVGAEGYTWERVSVIPLEGGLRRVELVPSGSLTIEVTGVESKAAAQLRVRREGRHGPVVDWLLRKDGPVFLSGLRPGTYQVTAEIGDHWDSPVVLGKGEAQVDTGLSYELLLSLEAPPSFEAAALAGRIHIATEWGISRPRVVFDFLDTPLNGFDDHQFKPITKIASERAGFDSFEFKAEGMQVGRYSVALYDPRVAIGVDLLVGGLSDVELVVGAPVELLVYVIDHETQEQVDTEKLSYNIKRPKGVSGGTLEQATYDEIRGAYIVDAPESVVELMLWTWTHLPYQGEVDLTEGVREHTIELERASGYDLSMVDEEGALVPFPEDWSPTLDHVNGEGTRSLMTGGTEFKKALVTEPGTYVLSMPKIPGFVDPGSQRLEIPPGEIVKTQVVLQRE